MAQLKNTTVSDIGFLQLPAGTTGQRPTPAAGQMRFNTSTGKAEFYDAGLADWVGTAGAGVVATGGNSVYDIDVEGTTYRVHVFTTTGNSTFTVAKGGEVEYLVVAGGGAGAQDFAGGGGAGGLLTGTTTVSAQSYTIVIGAGGNRPTGGSTQGAGTSAMGSNSSVFGLTAIGGGAGAGSASSNNAGSGGSGGGAGSGRSAGSGTSGQGSNGVSTGSGVGGGGGGAGGVGLTNGNGGIGIFTRLTGYPIFYAGGGGGTGSSNESRPGGLGGGGTNTGYQAASNNGTPNTGGGGSAFYGSWGGAGNGGSGIVIVRYPLRQENPVAAAGKVIGDGLVLDLDFAKPTVYAGSGSTVSDSRLNGISFNRAGSPDFRNARTHRSGFDIAGNEANYLESVGTVRFENQWTYEFLLENNGDNRAIPLMTGRNGSDQRSKINLDLGYQNSGRNHIFIGSDWGSWQVFTTPLAFSAYTTILLQVTMNSGVANVWWTTPQSGRIQPINNVNYGTGGNIVRDLPILIGKYASAGYVLNGIVHLFRFYNRALTTDELNKNYEALKWRFGV